MRGARRGGSGVACEVWEVNSGSSFISLVSFDASDHFLLQLGSDHEMEDEVTLRKCVVSLELLR